MMQATQHVRESQEEIQQAQAQRSDGGRHMEEPETRGRRSRAAAMQAKQSLQMMQGNEEQIDQVVFDPLPEDESSLYFIIRNGKASLQQVIDDWIDEYKADRDAALLKLMQFFISTGGCKGRI